LAQHLKVLLATGKSTSNLQALKNLRTEDVDHIARAKKPCTTAKAWSKKPFKVVTHVLDLLGNNPQQDEPLQIVVANVLVAIEELDKP
jgi:hypothetical protein